MKTILKETQQGTTPTSVSGTTGTVATTAQAPLHGQTLLHEQAPLQSTQYHTAYVGEAAREIHVAPTVLVEKFEKPTIVKETILPQEKIEVQPIIHREREQLEVHEVVQPLHERDIAATSVRHATLPAEVRAEVRESDTAFKTSYREAATRYVPEVHTEAVRREVVNRPAIIEEHLHKKIVEEIQPVLYRETVTPVVIEEMKPIYEKIIEAPRIVEETKPMVDLGTRYTELPTSQMGNLSLGGQTYQTYESLPYLTQTSGQTYQTYESGSLSYSGQPVSRETTVTRETFIEPLRETHTSTHPHKETKEFYEPARATSHPHTETKRIV